MPLQAPEPSRSKWTDFSEVPARLEGLTLSQIQRFKNALIVLERVAPLGPMIAFPTGIDIILEAAFNEASWTSEMATWLAESIESLSTYPGYDALLAMIRSPSRRGESFELLSLADLFLSAGLSVSFEPIVAKKRPDLAVAHKTDWQILVEHRKIGISDQERRAQATLDYVVSSMQREFPTIAMTGKIFKSLSQFSIDALLQDLRKAAAVCVARRGTIEVSTPRTAWFRLCLQDCAHSLRHAPLPAGLEIGAVEGPPIHIDEVARTWGKVKEESKHFPRGMPGLIVIENPRMLLGDAQEMPGNVEQFAEAIYDIPNVIGVVLTTENIDPGAGNCSALIGSFRYHQRLRFKVLCSRFIVIPNLNFRGAISNSVIARVFDAFATARQPELNA